jgi:NAD(P)-dependent dehydrogenase (short-subunit alcohol dehydrogenase family)
MSLKDKVVFITGGTSGIGETTAFAFAKAGAHVVLTGRREKEGNEVAAKIRSHGVQGVFVKADVSKEADVQNAIAEALKLKGRIDVAFNNAGVEEALAPIVEKTEADFDQVFDINVKGVFFSLKHEVAAMVKSGGGSIINTSSIAGTIGMGNFVTYVASKHAVDGYTKAVALEVAKQKIRVNAVAPAAIQTPMFDRFAGAPGAAEYMASLHPIGRVGKPEEVSSVVLWLAGDTSSFVTGQSILVDGGFTAQ